MKKIYILIITIVLLFISFLITLYIPKNYEISYKLDQYEINEKYNKEQSEKVRENNPVIINILLILAAVLSSLVYSDHIRNEKTQMQIDAFCSTMEGMKQVSGNYLKMEKGYAENWANYIERQNMTMDEALDYIKNSNSQKDRHAHIVDMDRGFRSSK